MPGMGFGFGFGFHCRANNAKRSDSDCKDAKPILCGLCDAELRIPAECKPEDWVACNCGNGDKLENVQRIVAEFLKEQAPREAQETLKDTTRGSENLEFEGKPIVKGKHRFYVRLEG